MSVVLTVKFLCVEARAASDAIAASLQRDRFAVAQREPGEFAVVGRRSDFRWEWFATRLHTFVLVFHITELTTDTAEAFTAQAQSYAITHKGGLPRGLQTGTAAIPVLLAGRLQRGISDWVERRPKHRFGALRFPVVIDLERQSATYFAGKWGGGYIYREHVLSIVRKDIVQPLVETGLRTCPPH